MSARRWMQTYTGRRFYLRDPDPASIVLEDIAHHLAQLCRFTGAVRRFYSVAQHSVHVAQHLDREHPENARIARWGLLHDASEAYINDLSRPLKLEMGAGAYSALERGIMAAVAVRFGLPALPLPLPVEVADTRMLFTERRDLLMPLEHGDTGADWGHDRMNLEPYEEVLHPWGPESAETMFLSAATRLGVRYAQ